MKKTIPSVLTDLLFVAGNFSYARDNSGAFAQGHANQLANPVASLISVAFQNTFDYKIGLNEGFRYHLNLRPVPPTELRKNWNLKSSTKVPCVSQGERLGTAGNYNR